MYWSISDVKMLFFNKCSQIQETELGVICKEEEEEEPIWESRREETIKNLEVNKWKIVRINKNYKKKKNNKLQIKNQNEQRKKEKQK